MFAYLCLLNRFGLRSYCDFSQYFVIPWILSDYGEESDKSNYLTYRRDLSLPMGQIGENRRPKFDQIWEDSDNQYYYGTHYMHFGVVLYYLFRLDPFCLFSIYLHHYILVDITYSLFQKNKHYLMQISQTLLEKH